MSLHDVAPCTQQIASTILSELSAHGERVASVLVVPDYHHEGLFANTANSSRGSEHWKPTDTKW